MTSADDLGTIVQGDTYTQSIQVQDDGDPIDISGWTVTVTVKETVGDQSYAIQRTITTHDDPANGLTSFTFTGTDTDGLQGEYVYDIQIDTDGGETYTPLLGNVYFSRGVTE